MATTYTHSGNGGYLYDMNLNAIIDAVDAIKNPPHPIVMSFHVESMSLCITMGEYNTAIPKHRITEYLIQDLELKEAKGRWLYEFLIAFVDKCEELEKLKPQDMVKIRTAYGVAPVPSSVFGFTLAT